MEKLTFKQYILETPIVSLTAYHITRQSPEDRPYLQASQSKTAINSSDKLVGQLLPWYLSSVFFSIGWAAALEWEEFSGGVVYELKYPVAYLLSNFSCVLLIGDHMLKRYNFLEYFIPESDKDEYFALVAQATKESNNLRTRQGITSRLNKHQQRPFIHPHIHPKLSEWHALAKNATPQQLKTFIVNELLLKNKTEILNYLTHNNTTECELLVQGKIPISKAEQIRRL